LTAKQAKYKFFSLKHFII